MDDKDVSDLETLNRLFEVGNEQIRHTFDLYLELLDKFREMDERNRERTKDER